VVSKWGAGSEAAEAAQQPSCWRWQPSTGSRPSPDQNRVGGTADFICDQVKLRPQEICSSIHEEFVATVASRFGTFLAPVYRRLIFTAQKRDQLIFFFLHTRNQSTAPESVGSSEPETHFYLCHKRAVRFDPI
jgi:hypothetical protein